MVAYTKSNPGKLSYGSGGSGATGYLAMELLKWPKLVRALDLKAD